LSVSGDVPWRLSYYPYFTGGGGEGILLAARVRFWQPAEFEDRVTARGSISLDVGANFQSSRFALLRFRAPLLKHNWRGVVTLGASRQGRFGFYGLGNETTFDKANENESQPDFYRVARTRYALGVEVTRHLIGPLHAALLVGVERTFFDALADHPTVFGNTFGPTVRDDDAFGRLALVVDTRDNEYNPGRGLLFDAGFQLGSSGDGYERGYASVTGYLPLAGATLLAAHVAGSGMSRDAPLKARSELPLWESPLTVYGGIHTNRAYINGRFTGRGTLFGQLELRKDVFSIGDIGYVTLLGFVETGRVFEEENFQLTLDGLHTGGGLGLAMRLLRTTAFTLNAGYGGEGVKVTLGSGFTF
jgi:outer membrane protein assembly factor BamA